MSIHIVRLGTARPAGEGLRIGTVRRPLMERLRSRLPPRDGTAAGHHGAVLAAAPPA